jgi:hypothetical protein
MTETKFESWGLVELFGHQRVAGRITEQQVGGCNFVRVDIPQGEGFYTRLFGQGAIYAINLTDEAAARVLAARYAEEPPYAYELKNAQPRLAASPASQAPIEDDYGEPEAEDDERG